MFIVFSGGNYEGQEMFNKRSRGTAEKGTPLLQEKQGSMVHVLRKNITGGEICFACMF